MRALFITLLFAATACASGGLTERAYQRDGLSDVKLRSLDVVVVAKGPPLAAGSTLDIDPFPVPTRTSVLPAKVSADETEAALAAALAEELGADGFQLRMIRGAENGDAGSPGPVGPAPPVQTSTAVVSSTTTQIRGPEGPPARVQGPGSTTELPPKTRLQDVLDASKADGVLVVRVVVVDEFRVHQPSEGAPRLDATGQVVARKPGKSFPVRGRLLIGQAFLYDRRTGLRLWSRQLPDFPEGGKITRRHPILRYGFVQRDKAAMEENVKASRAANRFVDAMFAEFPHAQEGSPEARAALDAVDVESEIEEQRFFDDSRILLDVEAGWAAESSGSDLTLDGEPLPSLGTGAVSPNGIGRVGVRLGYMTTSAWVLSVAGQFGLAPGSFGRSYHRDARQLGVGGLDRSAAVTIDGASTYMAEASVGYSLLLADSLLLVPGVDLFLDVWSVDARPALVVQDRTHLRGGAGVDLDLLYQLSALLYGKISIGGRGGFDSAGPAFGGIHVSVGVGLFL